MQRSVKAEPARQPAGPHAGRHHPVPRHRRLRRHRAARARARAAGRPRPGAAR
nr:hypothetical protein [Angustibacter aerolatus]